MKLYIRKDGDNLFSYEYEDSISGWDFEEGCTIGNILSFMDMVGFSEWDALLMLRYFYRHPEVARVPKAQYVVEKELL